MHRHSSPGGTRTCPTYSCRGSCTRRGTSGRSSRHLSNPDCSGTSHCSRIRYLSSHSGTRLRTEGSMGAHTLALGTQGRGARPRTERAIVVRVPREALALASKALTIARAPAGAGARLTALHGGTCLGRHRQDGLRPQRRSSMQKGQKGQWRGHVCSLPHVLFWETGPRLDQKRTEMQRCIRSIVCTLRDGAH